MENRDKKVIIIGASNKPDRYSYKALKMLQEYDYQVIPVNPVLEEIEGVPVRRTINEIDENVYAITIYMRWQLWEPLMNEIIRIKPGRVILNPGTESRELQEILEKSGIEVLEACTLVLLRTKMF
jgi:predicted CoA-binding protein